MKNRLGMLLLMAVVVPCLLCSGMAALVGRRDFGMWVLGVILALYLVTASVALLTWLAIGRPPSETGTRDDKMSDAGREL